METKRFDVFTIHEYTHERQIKNLWTKIGNSFQNSDGSWNLRLYALPITNPKSGLAELHMREPKPEDAPFKQSMEQPVDESEIY